MLSQAAVDAAKNFWSFDIGNISVILGLLLQGLLLYGNSSWQHGENSEKIAALVEWKQGHDLDAKQRDEAISELRQIASRLAATADGISNRMDTIQADVRELRRKGITH